MKKPYLLSLISACFLVSSLAQADYVEHVTCLAVFDDELTNNSDPYSRQPNPSLLEKLKNKGYHVILPDSRSNSKLPAHLTLELVAGKTDKEKGINQTPSLMITESFCPTGGNGDYNCYVGRIDLGEVNSLEEVIEKIPNCKKVPVTFAELKQD